MTPRLKPFAALILCIAAFSFARAQQPAATPTPDDAVRIRTEEVHLTLRAEGPIAGHTPKLRTSDFTIFEDGVAQSVTSVRSLPARVFVLMDMGAALTFAKDRDVVNLAAQLLVSNLPEGSYFSVAQYSDAVEPIVEWTNETAPAVERLIGSIKIGRRSLMAPALEHVVESFRTQPSENRHLILVTDGLNGAAAIDPESAAFKDLAAANIVVHVISLTAIEEEGAKDAAKVVRLNTRKSKPRVPRHIFNDMINSLPMSSKHREYLINQNEAQQIIIIDLDGERRRMLKARRAEWDKGEVSLRKVTSESGGAIKTPFDSTALLTSSIEVARGIGSHFDVTYEPSRTIADGKEEVERKIAVESKSDALRLRLRKVLVVKR